MTNEDTKVKIQVENAREKETNATREDQTELQREPSLEEQLEQAKEKCRESEDKMLRSLAELENFKKRSLREMEDFRKFANERIIKDLLPILDNLERALESAQSGQCDLEALTKGVEMTRSEISKLLETQGVECVKASGQPFDPCFHQALMQEPSDEHPENTVLREMQKGYIMKDRLIRPSLVVVSAGSNGDNGPADAK